MALTSEVTLRPEWLIPSTSYGWRAVARNTLPLLIALALAPLLADRNAVLAWVLMPVIGLLLYRLSIVMHDCTHRTLFRARRTNELVGSVLAAMTGIDFHRFTQRHWQHHRSFGEDHDTQGFQYLQLPRMRIWQFRWHLLKPLLALNLHHVLSESLLAPRNLLRIFATGEWVLVAAVQLVLLAIVTGWARHLELVLLPFVATSTFGLFFSQLRGIAEHGNTKSNAVAGNVRSHLPSVWDRVFLYDVNFNYHIAHHRHPEVPSYHLPAVHRALDEPGHSTGHSMFATLQSLLASLRNRHAKT